MKNILKQIKKNRTQFQGVSPKQQVRRDELDRITIERRAARRAASEARQNWRPSIDRELCDEVISQNPPFEVIPIYRDLPEGTPDRFCLIGLARCCFGCGVSESFISSAENLSIIEEFFAEEMKLNTVRVEIATRDNYLRSNLCA